VMAKVNRSVMQELIRPRRPKNSSCRELDVTRSLHSAQCSLTVPFPLNSLWGTGTARWLGFSLGNRLRSFEHIGSSRSAKSPTRAPAVAESGPFSDVSADLHGVQTPGDTTHALDQNPRRRIFCGKSLAISGYREMLIEGQRGIVRGDRNRKSRTQS